MPDTPSAASRQRDALRQVHATRLALLAEAQRLGLTLPREPLEALAQGEHVVIGGMAWSWGVVAHWVATQRERKAKPV